MKTPLKIVGAVAAVAAAAVVAFAPPPSGAVTVDSAAFHSGLRIPHPRVSGAMRVARVGGALKGGKGSKGKGKAGSTTACHGPFTVPGYHVEAYEVAATPLHEAYDLYAFDVPPVSTPANC